jgi:SAM-dependent methyltransferase
MVAPSEIYGRDFAAIYNVEWAFWGSKMWPFLHRQVQRRRRRDGRSLIWLDLCCGAGSLLEYICSAGYSAVGLDASAAQLRHARENAPGARLVRGDVRELDLGREFDVVTCLYDSLNYLTRKGDLLRVFRRVRRHLGPGGLFVFDVNTVEGLEDQWNRTFTLRDRGYVLVVESTFDAREELGTCVFTGFLKEGRRYRRFDERHVQRGFRAAEVEAALEKAGLVVRGKRDGDTLGRARKRSPRLLYLCGRR